MPKVKPPSPPKSDLPGKNIPVSEKRLAARDRVPETEEKKAGASGAFEESQEKEAGGGKKETEETKKEEGDGEEGDEEEKEEADEDEDEEEEDESEIEIAKSVKKYSNLLSPEAVVFLPLAILLDLISIVLICFGLDDFHILDVIGIATIGAWVFYKTGIAPPAPESTMQKAEKAKEAVRGARASGEIAEKAGKIAAKAGKYGRWLRPLLCILGEIIYYVGAIPFWTYLVYKTLTDTS